jgi:hypothetical protein
MPLPASAVIICAIASNCLTRSFTSCGATPAPVAMRRRRGWSIVLDGWLLEKLLRLRSERLPNETGGVLIGAFDTFHRVCSIVDVLSSPPDSKEWPTSYIRGCLGRWNICGGWRRSGRRRQL